MALNRASSVTDPVAAAEIAAFRRDGAVCLHGLFTEWVERLRAGVAANEAAPGPHAEDAAPGEGRFFGDYCNWQRIATYEDFVRHSQAAPVAAALMDSQTVRMFHEHLLIKEPGTSKRTPWHQDLPYYNVQGEQTVSFWIALDSVAKATCPEFLSGSNLWDKLFYPRNFTTLSDYPYEGGRYETVPDIEAARGDHEILSWDLAPGDAIAFSYRTLHGAPPNHSSQRRRGFSLRLLGDDVRYAVRPGETSPPLGDIGLAHGDPLDETHFPTIWRRPNPV